MKTLSALALGAALMSAGPGFATAAPVKYTVDPDHTYPEFHCRSPRRPVDLARQVQPHRGHAGARSAGANRQHRGEGRPRPPIDTGHDKLNGHLKSARLPRRREASDRHLHRQAREVPNGVPHGSRRHIDAARRHEAGQPQDRLSSPLQGASDEEEGRLRCRTLQARSIAKTSASATARTTAST